LEEPVLLQPLLPQLLAQPTPSLELATQLINQLFQALDAAATGQCTTPLPLESVLLINPSSMTGVPIFNK